MIRLHEIGLAVRTRREEVGLSMQQLAAFSGMDAHALAALENGKLSQRSLQWLSPFGRNATLKRKQPNRVLSGC